MTLRTKASFLLAASITIALSITAIFYLGFLEHSLKNSIYSGLEGVSQATSEAIAKFLDDSLRDVQLIASTLPAEDLRAKNAARIEERMRASAEIFPKFENGMFVLDADGILWADYPVHPEVVGRSFAFREYFQRTMMERKGIIGTPYRSARTKEPVLTFTAPLRGPGNEILGMLGCSVQLLHHNALGGVRDAKIGRSGYISVIDSSRMVIIHPKEERVLQTEDARTFHRLFDLSPEGAMDSGELVDSGGARVLFSHRHIRGTDWILVAQQPESEAFLPIREARFRILLTIVVAASFAVLLGLLAIRNITRPLMRLREAVLRFGGKVKDCEGAYPVRGSNPSKNRSGHGSDDEISELAEVFAQMSTTLDHSLELLRSSAEDWERTFDSVADAILILDSEYRVVRLNRSAAGLIGVTPDRAAGRRCFEIMHGTDEPPAFCPNLRTLANIEQSRIVIKDPPSGKVLEVTTTPLLNPNGEAIGCVEAIRDISERKKIEEELKRTKEYLENVIENAVDSIGIVDSEGTFVIWNKRSEEIFGYSYEEMKGKHYAQLYAHEEEMIKLLSVLRKEGVVREFEASMRTRNGETVPMELSVNLLRDEDEKTVGSICVARDLRDKKLLESQLLHAVKMEAVGTLAGGIAHDFNNLLQAVQGYAELLCFDKAKDDPQYSELQEIVRAARRGGELTKQLLTFSRKVQSRLRPMNLNHEVVQVAKLLERTISKMIRIELLCERDLRPINGDPAQMEQVLMNLGINAKDAMPDGGKLVIETKNVILGEEYCRLQAEVKPGDYVLLSVTDTGHGIDPESMGHIFDPFYTTKEVGKGSGLGLSMVYGIVKNHGGHIDTWSEPGKGSSFRIYLPAIQSVDESSEISMLAQLPTGTETILVVDDEDSVRDFAHQILTRYGYKVMTAPDGESALRLHQSQAHIDLTILDLIMPGMGGSQCLMQLRDIVPHAKVIIASGCSYDNLLMETIRIDSRHFIAKPYQVGDMLRMVRDVLDEPHTESGKAAAQHP